MRNFDYLSQPQTVTQFTDKGTLGIREKEERIRKPAWLVVTKLCCVVGMIIFGLFLLPDQLPVLRGAHTTLVTLAVIAVYTLVAFFADPRANMDNLGSFGGLGNDMFQCNDDINRNLLAFKIFLGPGRFIASTFVDAATLVGLVPERTEDDIQRVANEKVQSKRSKREAEIKARVAAQRVENGNEHEIELDSAKYFRTQESGSAQ